MTHPTEWIYLFGSNTRALYAVDALNTLALPRGWKLHYRYEKRHVDDRLWQSLVAAGNNPSALGGARLVLNFVNQETVTSSEGKISYRPIEFFHIPPNLVVTPRTLYDNLEISTRSPHDVSSACET